MRKRTFFGAFVALMAFACIGCSPPGTINAATFNGLQEPVLSRHDNCVNNHMELTDTQRAAFLRSSALMRDLVGEALEGSDGN